MAQVPRPFATCPGSGDITVAWPCTALTASASARQHLGEGQHNKMRGMHMARSTTLQHVSGTLHPGAQELQHPVFVRCCLRGRHSRASPDIGTACPHTERGPHPTNVPRCMPTSCRNHPALETGSGAEKREVYEFKSHRADGKV